MTAIDWTRVDHLRWHADGTCSLGGALLARLLELDRHLQGWADDLGADHYRFPDLVPLDVMRRIGYLASFPHLATFAAPLTPNHERLDVFVAEERTGVAVPVDPALLAPPQSILAPAACFHVYAQLQDRDLARVEVATVCGQCYRNERNYAPLQRQQSFAMRELVCIGSAAEVEAFLSQMSARAGQLANALQLPVAWAQAADPFFDPAHDPRHLAQRLQPLKTELQFCGELALCSANMHGNFFGEAFAIRRDGRTAASGCIAFGLERWLYALLRIHGPDCRDWPRLAGDE